MADKTKPNTEVKTGSFFLTDEIIDQALQLVSSKAKVIFGDDKVSGGNKFGVLVARVRGIPVKDVIIGDINEANNNPARLKDVLIKAKCGLRMATQHDMTVTEILRDYPENLEYGDFLFVGTAIESKSSIIVAVCATENESDNILAQEMINQIKKLSKQARDKYIAENQDKLTKRLK